MNVLRFSKPLVYNSCADRTLNQLLGNLEKENYYSIPQANVSEGKDSFKIEIAVPGYSKEQIGIQFQENVLMVKGSVEENSNQEEKYLTREFGLKSFIRRFSIPKTADTDHINAAFSNGILTITIPKKEEIREKEPKDIVID
jgi:HSP20 family protein